VSPHVQVGLSILSDIHFTVVPNQIVMSIPAFVKPFFPQLQRTFVKSASDPTSTSVRKKAAVALSALMKNQPRVDPVRVDQHGKSK
jgi:hypothetical protein